MDKRSMVISVLEDMGYQPRVDSDGDVLFRFQMKHLYVLATQQEETPFLVVMLPQFYEMSEGEEIKVLTVCNKDLHRYQPHGGHGQLRVLLQR